MHVHHRSIANDKQIEWPLTRNWDSISPAVSPRGAARAIRLLTGRRPCPESPAGRNCSAKPGNRQEALYPCR
jgi:hypothetical protein